jgi:hypothetical protein
MVASGLTGQQEKKPMRLVAASLITFVVAAGPAAAQNRIEIEDAIRIARENGIVAFREVERDDGRWEVEGRDAEGRKLELDIDAPGTSQATLCRAAWTSPIME